ncbi:hypothetical protein [Variovorax paradoxus]|uniref:hypothetical protein n=1 Tax=Variovorax paradoxus TaxID=34073 RepID=UPI002788770E|nr:hypothetical protein [Variovorax paradoxus]MDP9933490.1 hypothetical protein [Variovorax paradoxus]
MITDLRRLANNIETMLSDARPNSTATRFESDLEDLAAAFVDKFGLKFNKEKPNLSSPLLRWLDFRQRHVDPYPRPVVLSDKFPVANLPDETQKGLQQLIERFEQGADVNPYQGRGLIRKNDTSGEAKHARTDLLFADWGILHFHLTTKPIRPGRFFSEPDDYLAFCLVGGNGVAFLDVLPHPEKLGFANVDLFDTMARNWPEFMDKFKIRGQLLQSGAPLTTVQVSEFREAGVGAFYNFNGTLFRSPGGGVTSASTPRRLTLACDQISALVRTLATLVDDPVGQFRTHSAVTAVANPEFRLGIGSSGLCVVEAISKTDFLLPKAASNTELSWMQRLNNEFAPPWAAEALCPPADLQGNA